MQLTLNNDELAFGVHSNVVPRVQTLGLAQPFDEPQRRAGRVALNEIAGAKLVLGNAELRERNQCLLSVPFLFPPGIQEPETAVFKATIVRHSTVPDEALEDVAARHRKGQGLARAERRKPQFNVFAKVIEPNRIKQCLSLTGPTSGHAHGSVASEMFEQTPPFQPPVSG